MKSFIKYSSLGLLVFLNGCAWMFSSNHGTSHKKTSLPRAPTIRIPEGSGDNWRYIGTTTDGLIIIELNNNSIQALKNSNEIFNFEDRKTVVEPTQYTYAAGQPHFKYIINTWQIDCQNKKYLLLTANMFNQAAVSIGKFDYTNNSDVKWLNFGEGSIADLEYKFVCLNQNRNLGY